MFADVKCVTLDLDNTLWPIEPTINLAEEKLYQWIQLNYPKVTAKYSPVEIAGKRLALNKKYPEMAHNLTEIRWQSLQELANEFGYAKTLADEGLALFRQYRNQVNPYPASEPALSLLNKHFKVGAITNGNAQLNKISLGCYFDFVVTAADAGACKPDARLFKRAAEIADVTVNQIVHVGDCAKADVLGANNAGCLSVWLNMRRQAWPGGQTPHAVIHCISELPDLLIEHTN
jgi:putative hydrolase of the HAD superfamily